jgi:hypothetical protein
MDSVFEQNERAWLQHIAPGARTASGDHARGAACTGKQTCSEAHQQGMKLHLTLLFVFVIYYEHRAAES